MVTVISHHPWYLAQGLLQLLLFPEGELVKPVLNVFATVNLIVIWLVILTGVRIFEGHQEERERLSYKWLNSKTGKEYVRIGMEEMMEGLNARIVKRNEAVGKIEVHFDRVAVWTLIFTNTFFLSYFFAKLFRWI